MPATEAPPAAPPESPQAPAAAAKMGNMFRQKMAGQEKPPVAPVVPPPKPAVVTAPVAPSVPPKAGEEQKPAALENSKEVNFARLNADFDKFRATSESRIKELEAQRTREREELSVELTTTKAELQKKQDFMERFALEHEDRFKAAFDEKIAEFTTDARRAVGKEMAAKVEAIFRMPPSEWRDSAFKELRGEVEDEFDRTRLINAYQALEKTQVEREKALANPRENLAKLKQLDEQSSMFQRVEQKRVKEALYADFLSKGEEAFPDLKPVEGNDEHNARVNEDRQWLRDFITGDLSQNDMGNLALYAVKGMRAIQTDVAKDALIGKLQEQIQKLTAAQPGLNGSGERTRSADEKPDANRVLARFHQAREQGVPEAG